MSSSKMTLRTSADVAADKPAPSLQVSEGQARLEQSLRRAVAREIALKEAEVGQGQTLLQHRANVLPGVVGRVVSKHPA